MPSSFFGGPFQDFFREEDIFTDDLRKSSCTDNPTVLPQFDLVYVLSGRTTALKNDADGLQREFDPLDDLERLQEGVRIAMLVNALRVNKKPEDLAPEDYVTPIFYNGRAIHNRDLKEALQRGVLGYPRDLFIIRPISPENTLGQIQAFNQYLHANKHRHVALVSSAYHLPRVARIMGADSPQANGEIFDKPLRHLKIFLFGVHKQERRPGMVFDLPGELNAMRMYSASTNPSISRYCSKNVFFTDQDVCVRRHINASLFWGNRKAAALLPQKIENVEKEATLDCA